MAGFRSSTLGGCLEWTFQLRNDWKAVCQFWAVSGWSVPPSHRRVPAPPVHSGCSCLSGFIHTPRSWVDESFFKTTPTSTPSQGNVNSHHQLGTLLLVVVVLLPGPFSRLGFTFHCSSTLNDVIWALGNKIFFPLRFWLWLEPAIPNIFVPINLSFGIWIPKHVNTHSSYAGKQTLDSEISLKDLGKIPFTYQDSSYVAYWIRYRFDCVVNHITVIRNGQRVWERFKRLTFESSEERGPIKSYSKLKRSSTGSQGRKRFSSLRCLLVLFAIKTDLMKN